ncbi:hypothetical protein EDM68_00845 [Candidatus Uhrbacteria bacterium]|nr:MAG: hypothetical protein EDM68_00845 [Candidatus Uhrbacteria bacterium]
MASHPHAVEKPHDTRYHVPNHPPERFYAILRRLAKATRDPAYRTHGGFHTADVIRGHVKTVLDLPRGDADDVVRFLKREEILVSDRAAEAGAVWKFDPEKADAVYDACVRAGTAEAKDRTMTSFVERASSPDGVSDSDRPSGVHGVSPETRAEPSSDYSVYEDETLDDVSRGLTEREAQLERDLERVRGELAAIEHERHRRTERRRLEQELETVRREKEAALLRSQELEEQELEIAQRIKRLKQPTY